MRILVSGGNGSVGCGLIPSLLAQGHRVVVLDKDLGVVRVIAHPQLSFVQGAVEDPAAVAGPATASRPSSTWPGLSRTIRSICLSMT